MRQTGIGEINFFMKAYRIIYNFCTMVVLAAIFFSSDLYADTKESRKSNCEEIWSRFMSMSLTNNIDDNIKEWESVKDCEGILFEYRYSFLLALAERYAEASKVLNTALSGNLEKDDKKTLMLQKINIDIYEAKSKKNSSMDMWRNIIGDLEALNEQYKDWDEVYRLLGQVYYEIGNTEKAIHYSKKALEIRPTTPIHNILALLYFDIGDYYSCAKTFENSIIHDESNIKNEEIVFVAVYSYFYLKEYQAAKQLLGILIAYKPYIRETKEYKKIIREFSSYEKSLN